MDDRVVITKRVLPFFSIQALTFTFRHEVTFFVAKALITIATTQNQLSFDSRKLFGEDFRLALARPVSRSASHRWRLLGSEIEYQRSIVMIWAELVD